MLKHCQPLFLLLFFIILKVNLTAQDLNAIIIMPAEVRSDEMVSIVVKVKNSNQTINTSVNGIFQISAGNALLDNPLIKINRGFGSTTTRIIASGNFTVSLEGLTGQIAVLVKNDVPVSQQNGEIAKNTLWANDSIYHISDELTVLPSATLTIGAGTNIYMGEKINVIVQGNIQINGTLDEPVVFKPLLTEKPWGGIRFISSTDSSAINYCFFVNGGNNEQFIFGHSNSQPVIYAEYTKLNIDNSFFVDNPGKAIGAIVSKINISNGLFSRCDTGGEYDDCYLNVSDTYFIDFPLDDGIPVDDDNDAIYIYGVYPSAPGPSVIDKCTFITGKDDGIDHNGSVLEVKNCWIQGFYHEGIAASNTNSMTAYNTLIKDCEQGIEAGYFTPQVFIDHCVMINNSNGLRFGDSYAWGCGGHITATNSILFNNADNILNYDLLTQGPIPGAITISYSMTNDIDYDGFTGCITGIPLFDPNFYLLPGSPGIGMATDGGNIGLVDPLVNISDDAISKTCPIKISPNPFCDFVSLSINLSRPEDDLQIRVYNAFGMLQYIQDLSQSGNDFHSVMLQCRNFPKGLYSFVLFRNNAVLDMQKAIKL